MPAGKKIGGDWPTFEGLDPRRPGARRSRTASRQAQIALSTSSSVSPVEVMCSAGASADRLPARLGTTSSLPPSRSSGMKARSTRVVPRLLTSA
jgi:hypothetical protein